MRSFDIVVMEQNVTIDYYLVIGALITVLAGVWVHSGILHRIVVKCDKMIPQKLVIGYKISYTQQLAKQHLNDALTILPTYKKIRIIYDKNLRLEGAVPLLVYATGFILSLNGELPENDMQLFMSEMGYTIHMFPEVTYALRASHPYRNVFSVNMARSRVYGKLSSYITKRSLCAHPKFEIYGESNILFMLPLHRQDDFYVDEAVMIPSYITNGMYVLRDKPHNGKSAICEKLQNGKSSLREKPHDEVPQYAYFTWSN